MVLLGTFICRFRVWCLVFVFKSISMPIKFAEGINRNCYLFLEWSRTDYVDRSYADLKIDIQADTCGQSDVSGTKHRGNIQRWCRSGGRWFAAAIANLGHQWWRGRCGRSRHIDVRRINLQSHQRNGLVSRGNARGKLGGRASDQQRHTAIASTTTALAVYWQKP